MPIAYDVKNLAQDIEVSYGERMAYLSDLFRGVDNTLKTFHHRRQRMATDLWDFLTSDQRNREKLVNILRSKNQKELSMMVEELTFFLKKSRRNMQEETASLMSQIRDYLGSMEKEISALLSQFQTERKDMGRKTKEDLVSTTKRRITQVKKTLKTFAQEHEARSNQLRRELSSFQKELESAVKKMRASNFNDLNETKQTWQSLAKIMLAKRAGKEVVKAREAFSEGELKEKVAHLISQSRQGITLPQLGKALKISYIRLAKPVSDLVKAGKVKKEDSQYFPA